MIAAFRSFFSDANAQCFLVSQISLNLHRNSLSSLLPKVRIAICFEGPHVLTFSSLPPTIFLVSACCCPLVSQDHLNFHKNSLSSWLPKVRMSICREEAHVLTFCNLPRTIFLVLACCFSLASQDPPIFQKKSFSSWLPKCESQFALEDHTFSHSAAFLARSFSF